MPESGIFGASSVTGKFFLVFLGTWSKTMSVMNRKANAQVRGHRLRRKPPCSVRRVGRLFCGHQAFPRTPERQLYSERRRQKQVDFSRLDFLEVARRDLGFFSKFILSPSSADPLPAHVCAKYADSPPLFFGNCHDILHRLIGPNVNDVYIVKKYSLLLKEKPTCSVLIIEGTAQAQAHH